MTKTEARAHLEQAFSLGSKIALYVPSTQNGNGNLAEEDRQELLRNIVGQFAELFGGATILEARGAWKSSELGLIVEDVSIVESYSTADVLDSNLATVYGIALELKRELQQEAVSLELGGHLYFV